MDYTGSVSFEREDSYGRAGEHARAGGQSGSAGDRAICGRGDYGGPGGRWLRLWGAASSVSRAWPGCRWATGAHRRAAGTGERTVAVSPGAGEATDHHLVLTL